MNEHSENIIHNYKTLNVTSTSAYNKIAERKRKELCFIIPLLKMDSTVCKFKDMVLYKKPVLEFILNGDKTNNYVSKCMGKALCGTSTTDVATNFSTESPTATFSLVYRETKIFNDVGHMQQNQVLNIYSLKRFFVYFENTCKQKLIIEDRDYNFNNFLIITHWSDNQIEKIKLSLSLPNKLNYTNNKYFDHKELLFEKFILTRKQAEFFNQSFQISENYYLFDISKFIQTHVQLTIKNNLIAAYNLNGIDNSKLCIKLSFLLKKNETGSCECYLFN